MTEFEKWFADSFQRLLEEVSIPMDQLSQPQDGLISWDRRAAWLLYVEYKKTGRAGPVSPDLFDDSQPPVDRSPVSGRG